MTTSGGATPGRARSNALAEIPLPWLSKFIMVKLLVNIF